MTPLEVRKIVREQIEIHDEIKRLFDNKIRVMDLRDNWIRINNDFTDGIGIERKEVDVSIYDKQINEYTEKIKELQKDYIE